MQLQAVEAISHEPVAPASCSSGQTIHLAAWAPCVRRVRYEARLVTHADGAAHHLSFGGVEGLSCAANNDGLPALNAH